MRSVITRSALGALSCLVLVACGGDTSAPDDPTPPVDTSLPPRIIDPVLADASERTGLAPGDIAVVRARPARWRDGSLGCPQPGRQYTQALVDGYWIVLRADGRELDYRLGSRGGFRLCESGGTEPLPREDV